MCESVKEILLRKQEIVQRVWNPFSVDFSADEINILSDRTALRELKLTEPFPSAYKCADDIFMCAKLIVEGDSIYRTLEFCMLKNRVLVPFITAVFKKMSTED